MGEVFESRERSGGRGTKRKGNKRKRRVENMLGFLKSRHLIKRLLLSLRNLWSIIAKWING